MLLSLKVSVLHYLILLTILFLAACDTAKNGPPSNPSNIAIEAQDSKVVISWDTVTGATSYTIYLASETGINKTNYKSKTNGQKVTNVSSPHTLTNLTNGTTYYFVVTALKGSLESTESNEKSATPTASGNPPDSPSNITTTAKNGAVEITWDTVTNAASYNLYLASETGVKKDNYSKKPNGKKVEKVTSPHTITGLTNGTAYYFVVTALKGNLESAESTEKSATPTASINLPNAPSNVVATAKNSAVEVTWDADTDATAYNLYFASEAGVKKDNYSKKANGKKVEKVTSPHTQSGLTNGTTYFLIVTAVNPKGESTESVEVSAKPVNLGKSFNPIKDTKLSAGSHNFDSINIPKGVKVILEGKTTFNVTGKIVIAGTLKGDCKALSLLGKEEISITGEIDNSCSNDSESADLIIKTTGGPFNIGTLDKPAKLGSSGEVDITNADNLADWEFDVLPNQRSKTKLAPVCSATSDTLWDTVVPDFPIAVDFSGDGADPDGGPVSYQWDFGDGNKSSAQNPVHSYKSHGVFDITLTVTDDDKQNCTATLRVVMDDGESNIPTESALWLEPDTLVVEVNQELGLTSFYDDPQNERVSYKWSFGDGNTSTVAIPRHKYAAAGRYEISLEITDTAKNVSKATAIVYAHSALKQSSLAPTQLPANACLGVPAGYRVFNIVFDGGKAAQGRNGKNKRYRGRGNVVLGSGTDIKAQDGGDGKDRTGTGDVQGGKGGRGGSLLFHVAGNLIVCAGAEFSNGNGGKGGSATSTGKKPWAKGGNGGDAGKKLSIKATTGLDFQSPFGFSTVLNPGSGGHGGSADSKGDLGADGCPVAKNGESAMARAGNGGKGSKVARIVGNVGGTGNILIKGGNGGNGANSNAEGGAGGNANCPDKAIGGNSGVAIANGGHGGPAQLSNLAGFTIDPNAFTAGNGGNSKAKSGAGGSAVATPSGPCKSTIAKGGKANKAVSTGGKGGKGKKDGKGGNAESIGGVGGSAKSTGGDCPNCGNGGDAEANGGVGANAIANFGEGPSGNNGTAKADAGDGGPAETKGGNGGDCDTCPKGKGGKGGNGTSNAGNGGEAKGNGTNTHGSGADANSVGGNGGRGANCCPPKVAVAMPGGDGGNGGDAIANAGTSKTAAKIGKSSGKSGNGGNGEDGWVEPGDRGLEGAVAGTPTKPTKGRPGVDGVPCPPCLFLPFFVSLPQGNVQPGQYNIPIIKEDKTLTKHSAIMNVRNDRAQYQIEGDHFFISQGGGLEFNFNNNPIIVFDLKLDGELSGKGQVQLRGLVNNEVVTTSVIDTSKGEFDLKLNFAEGLEVVYLEAIQTQIALPFQPAKIVLLPEPTTAKQ